MGNQDFKNKIPRNVARLNITLLVESAAGLAGTCGIVCRDEYDGYRLITDNGYFMISLSTIRNGHFIQIDSMETMPEEPAPVSFEELKKEYRRQYNRLYDGAGSPDIDNETSIYCSIFSVWRRSHVPFIRSFVEYNGDYVSSDREYAAFMLALMAGDYSRKAPEKKPRAIKTRTYNNFMKVYKLILSKGYTPEESEEITRGIFDDFERHPFGLSILERVGLVLDKVAFSEEYGQPDATEETTPEEMETTPATMEDSPEMGKTRPETVEGSPETCGESALLETSWDSLTRTATGEATPARIVTNGGEILENVPVFSRFPSLSRMACENAPQRTETRKGYKYTPRPVKTPPRGNMKAGLLFRKRGRFAAQKPPNFATQEIWFVYKRVCGQDFSGGCRGSPPGYT